MLYNQREDKRWFVRGAYSEASVPDVAGKTYFVTGANTGLGFETARVLAMRGGRVLMGCRSEGNAVDAMQTLRDRYPTTKLDLEYVRLDLADLKSVVAAAERVAQEPRLDGLINNAGVMIPPHTLTTDGFESQFGVNHLGHFALTGRLLSKLSDQIPGRVVTVSSAAHKFGRIDFDDLQAERGYKAGARYAMSKLANLLFHYELQKRLVAHNNDVIAVASHPGGANTELARHFPKSLYALLQPVAKWVINSAAEGALPSLRALTDPDVVSGAYFGPTMLFETVRSAVEVQSAPRARDPLAAKRLWDLSVQLTGVDPFVSN
jgi:NAD(P)-dependent dehydrogenase (short-subunit alcohol dehydrogenase family)